PERKRKSGPSREPRKWTARRIEFVPALQAVVRGINLPEGRLGESVLRKQSDRAVSRWRHDLHALAPAPARDPPEFHTFVIRPFFNGGFDETVAGVGTPVIYRGKLQVVPGHGRLPLPAGRRRPCLTKLSSWKSFLQHRFPSPPPSVSLRAIIAPSPDGPTQHP